MNENERLSKLLKNHELLSAQFMEIVIHLHILLDDFEKIHLWLTTENLNFGGFCPAQLIIRGKGNKVHNFIMDALGDDKLWNQKKI